MGPWRFAPWRLGFMLLRMASSTSRAVAVLFQALAPPVIAGVRKDPKPGGYLDSGADIAFTLRRQGIRVVTPGAHPDPTTALDWVFPDTREGLLLAVERGATVLWANTVLFSGHPLERFMGECQVVGQLPSAMQAFDDKFATNAALRQQGLPVAASVRASVDGGQKTEPLASLTEARLAELGLPFPLVVKPVRGRGSQGVTVVETHAAFRHAAAELMASGRFGDDLIVERFLGGAELTVTVMPGRGRSLDRPEGPWALPPVLRFNHASGVAPYNGTVAVTRNSRALTQEEQGAPAIVRMTGACVAAARVVGARAPIRIDCRADGDGMFRLFDLNMKPNMTGAGRPGREDQDSLSAIAARAMGWSYADLLLDMLAGAWREPAAASP
jgi:D-alanine-D-alanine ligase